MRQYVKDLQTFVESRGGFFHDDTGDPAMTLDMYEDGDHIDRQFHARYTELSSPAAALSMISHSLDFVFFFVVTVALYWTLPHRWQNVLLLAASYSFYGYVHPWSLTLIASSTFVDYTAAGAWRHGRTGGAISCGSASSRTSGCWVSSSTSTSSSNIHAVLAAAGVEVSRPTLGIVLPVGSRFTRSRL